MREKLWSKTPRYVKRILVGTDEYLNIWLNGRVGECVSSRVGKAALLGDWWALTVFMPVIDFVFGEDHCFKAIETQTKDHE